MNSRMTASRGISVRNIRSMAGNHGEYWVAPAEDSVSEVSHAGVAQRIGITRQRVSQVERKFFDRCRRMLERLDDVHDFDRSNRDDCRIFAAALRDALAELKTPGRPSPCFFHFKPLKFT